MDPAVGRTDLEESSFITVGKGNQAETHALLGKIVLLSEIVVMKLLTSKLCCSFSQHLQFESLDGLTRSRSSVLM